MDPYLVIARNSPGHDSFDDNAFLGTLHKKNEWNFKKYWLLELALYQTARQLPHKQQFTSQVFQIFSHISLLFTSHYDPNDVCHLDLSEDDIYELRDRVKMIFEGFFYGVMPSLSTLSGYRLLNPLLTESAIDAQ